MDRSEWVARKIAYRFADEAILELALTHRSASTANNERLEFLGDAVLGAVVSRSLFESRPDADEGTLSRLRARLVRRDTLADIAREIDLASQVRLGSGELRTGGYQRTSILANALEALIGAVCLDGGMPEAERIVLALYATRLAQLPSDEELTDPKTRLQEWLQARGLPPPRYDLRSVQGAPHAQQFEVVCQVDAFHLAASGAGNNRRSAEQAAADATLRTLEAQRMES